MVKRLAQREQHIAALQAEHDALAALLQELVKYPPTYYPDPDGDLDICSFCGEASYKPHESACLITRARDLLATMEAKL